MPSPKDEFDDAFFDYVGDMAEKAHGLERALRYIKDHLGQVCQEFETCKHASCDAACTSWLIAEAALSGDYRLPGEEATAAQADRPKDGGVPSSW